MPRPFLIHTSSSWNPCLSAWHIIAIFSPRLRRRRLHRCRRIPKMQIYTHCPEFALKRQCALTEANPGDPRANQTHFFGDEKARVCRDRKNTRFASATTRKPHNRYAEARGKRQNDTASMSHERVVCARQCCCCCRCAAVCLSSYDIYFSFVCSIERERETLRDRQRGCRYFYCTPSPALSAEIG